jgi:GDPmannose 4,6-dehydratase
MNYNVHGIIRRASTFNTSRIDHVLVDPHTEGARMYLHYGDLADSEQLSNIIYNVKPDEIYHLGAQSHVRVSFDVPEYTGNVSGLATTRILEMLRRSEMKIKFYQASSSELYGSSPPPQDETTRFQPRSPYACSKAYAYWMTCNYRDGYELFAINGILFNHESPRRGATFVTRKITRALASILAKKQSKVYLGNLEAKRDWGYAVEYVEAMWRMLQLDKPEDFVIGTGEQHSVREFLDEAFAYAGLTYDKYVEIDPRYYRPTEVDSLVANTAKAKSKLEWSPRVNFRELVKIMVDADMRVYGLKAIGEGDEVLAKKFPSRWWKVD